MPPHHFQEVRVIVGVTVIVVVMVEVAVVVLTKWRVILCSSADLRMDLCSRSMVARVVFCRGTSKLWELPVKTVILVSVGVYITVGSDFFPQDPSAMRAGRSRTVLRDLYAWTASD
jgi:hypothetical protein